MLTSLLEREIRLTGDSENAYENFCVFVSSVSLHFQTPVSFDSCIRSERLRQVISFVLDEIILFFLSLNRSLDRSLVHFV